MKKRILVGTLISIFLTVALVGISSADETDVQEELIVVCTTSALASLVKEVGGERIEVKTIVPAGMHPPIHDIKPGDVYAVSKASLVFFHGIEPWLETLINISENKKVRMVKVWGEWDSPALKIGMVRLIEQALSEYEPGYALYFEERAKSIINAIDKTSRELKAKAERLRTQEIKVICIRWQEGFVRWLGFEVIATYLSPEKLSLKKALELIKKGKEENVMIIIDNLQSGTDFGAKLASELGATQVILSNFPGAIPGTESHLKLIEYNAKQLLDAVEERQVEDEKT